MPNTQISQGIDKSSNIASLMVREKDVENASYALKAISHPLRLKILCVAGKADKVV